MTLPVTYNRFPEVPSDFGHWLAGLIDGEGCFSIHPNGTAWTAHFCVVLRADDRPILEETVRVTGIGQPYERKRPRADKCNWHPSIQWSVHRKAEKVRLIQLLDRYPLRAKKSRDYLIWREAVMQLVRHGGKGTIRTTYGLEGLSRQLRSTRAYDGPLEIELPEPVPSLFDAFC